MTQMFPSHKSLMSKPRILEAYEAGAIVIEPFVLENVGTNQVDVTLGPHFYRMNKPELEILKHRVQDHAVYNPFSQSIVEGVWYQQKAHPHAIIAEKLGWPSLLENIGKDERIIMIRPGETILGHTNEFIGGACSWITTMMKARSSTGRNCIEVCKCAGMGDIGYHNRWTMEITNNSIDYAIPLVVGRRIGQLVFFETDPLDDTDDYTTSGKYQTETDLKKLMENWRPADMLPKQWRDREVRALNQEE